MKKEIIISLKKVKHNINKVLLSFKRAFYRISGKKFVYIFGDSHVLNLESPSFIVTHVGPATAYNLLSYKSTTQARRKIDNKLKELSSNKKYFFLFVFGEIDCRIHIYNTSRKTKKPQNEIIEKTTQRYEKYLVTVKKRFPQSTILVMNVLPPGEEKNIYKITHYPTRILHMRIVKSFNQSLEKMCIRNKFVFIAVFDELLDKNDSRIKKYMFDKVHFNKNIRPFIFKQINSYILTE